MEITTSTSNNFKVKTATIDDMEIIFSLSQRSSRYYYDSTSIPLPFKKFYQDSLSDLEYLVRQGNVWVLTQYNQTTHTETIIGSIRLDTTVQKQSQIFQGQSALLSKLGIDPLYHGLGLGNLLVSALIQKAIASNFRWIYLYTTLSNAKLIAFYQKQHFQILGIKSNLFYPRGILSLYLPNLK